MDKYLIEVRHGGDKASCIRAIQIYFKSRSHLVSNVEWGCIEGENKAWLTIKTDNIKEAVRIIPTAYRENAKIIKLHKFTWDIIDENLSTFESQRKIIDENTIDFQV